MSSARVNPGSTCLSAWNVRIIRPEPISSINASATCTTTSVLRARRRSLLSLSERPPARNVVLRCNPACLNAGMMPNSKPATREMTMANNRTVPSIAI